MDIKLHFKFQWLYNTTDKQAKFTAIRGISEAHNQALSNIIFPALLLFVACLKV